MDPFAASPVKAAVPALWSAQGAHAVKGSPAGGDPLTRVAEAIARLIAHGLAAPLAEAIGEAQRNLRGTTAPAFIAEAELELAGLRADPAAAGELYDRIARGDGARPANIHVVAAMVFLGLNDIERAREALGACERSGPPATAAESLRRDLVRAGIARAAGDLPAARAFANASSANAPRTGRPYDEVLALTARASIRIDEGEWSAASADIDRALSLAASGGFAGLNFVLRMHRARLALAGGDPSQIEAMLRAALADGARHGFMSIHPWWSPDDVARLLAEAIRLGIEPEYTARLVRVRGLQPPQFADPNWPWPISVRLLGGLEIFADGAVLAWGRKAPRRALELLKLVAVHGPAPLPVATVLATLWPNAPPEAARRSFDVTVFRVRALLGRSDALYVGGGRIGLDASVCRVDAWYLGSTTALAEPANRRAQTLIALYRGSLLPEDSRHAWLVPHRLALHARFNQQAEALGSELEEQSLLHHAESLYRHAIGVDPAGERIARRLIELLVRTGRDADALLVYGRLVHALGKMHGRSPAPATEAVVRKVRKR